MWWTEGALPSGMQNTGRVAALKTDLRRDRCPVTEAMLRDSNHQRVDAHLRCVGDQLFTRVADRDTEPERRKVCSGERLRFAPYISLDQLEQLGMTFVSLPGIVDPVARTLLGRPVRTDQRDVARGGRGRGPNPEEHRAARARSVGRHRQPKRHGDDSHRADVDAVCLVPPRPDRGRSCTIFSAQLPRIRRATAFRPCDPTTIKEASVARCRIEDDRGRIPLLHAGLDRQATLAELIGLILELGLGAGEHLVCPSPPRGSPHRRDRPASGSSTWRSRSVSPRRRANATPNRVAVREEGEKSVAQMIVMGSDLVGRVVASRAQALVRSIEPAQAGRDRAAGSCCERLDAHLLRRGAATRKIFAPRPRERPASAGGPSSC